MSSTTKTLAKSQLYTTKNAGKQPTPISASERNRYNVFIRGIKENKGRIIMPDKLTYAVPDGKGNYSIYSLAGNEPVPGSESLSKNDLVNMAMIPNDMLNSMNTNPLIKQS